MKNKLIIEIKNYLKKIEKMKLMKLIFNKYYLKLKLIRRNY